MPIVERARSTEQSEPALEALRPYAFHGVEMTGTIRGGNATATCPFCQREGKLSISATTGEWRCFVCNTGTERGGGNAIVFVRKLHELSFEATPVDDYVKLAKARRLLFGETPMEWGWCKSIITGKWMLPGYAPDGSIRTLYVWGDKLYPTPTMGSWIFGKGEFRGEGTVLVCEGPWDGMAMHEVLCRVKESESGYEATSDQRNSLGAYCTVIAVPGCGSIGEPVKRWSEIVRDRDVELYFDNDLPQERNGRLVPPAGLEATKRAAEILTGCRSISYLKWGMEGYSTDLPHGYDLRDELSGKDPDALISLVDRVSRLNGLVKRLAPVPTSWAGDSPEESKGEGRCKPCDNFKDLVRAWRKAMRWTDGLDNALACMLASSMSTQLIGEQLWFEIIGPPSCGKTTVMEGLSTNKEYVLSKDTIRGFYSGWRDGDGEDSSLIMEAAGKTLAMKEGDAFIKAPNVQQILSEGRGIYDRVGRNHYRNATANDYEGKRMTWIICGTSAIREEIDSSELGARFLVCVVMDGIDDDFEDEVLWRAVNQESRSMVVESNGDAYSQHPEELSNAMYMTGGYVQYLRTHAEELISQIHISDETLRWCGRLGKFVAYMRARPTKKDDHQEREFGARLAKQMVRLTKTLAAVTQEPVDGPEIMKRIRGRAWDTARGMTLNIVELLAGHEGGMEPGAIVLRLNQQTEKVNKLLRFLRQIGVVELQATSAGQNGEKVKAHKRYVLTEPLRRLYSLVTQHTE